METYTIITIVDVINLLLLIYLIRQNTLHSSRNSKAFSVAILLVIVVSVIELIIYWLESYWIKTGYWDGYRILDIVLNIVGFSVTPIIPVALMFLVKKDIKKYLKYFSALIIFNLILFITTPITGWMFTVTKSGEYIRGPFYFLFTLIYVCQGVILIWANLKSMRRYDFSERCYLLIVFIVVLIGSLFQIKFEYIHSTWPCLTVALIMYYLFFRELEFKYDILTGVLNRRTYEIDLQRMKKSKDLSIIIFDVDDFKNINDKYGHRAGDLCLRDVAQIIKTNFSDIGKTYRFGGDEFLVFVEGFTEKQIKKIIENIINDLKKRRQEDIYIPMVSFGIGFYNNLSGHNIISAINDADENMYIYKQQRKN